MTNELGTDGAAASTSLPRWGLADVAVGFVAAFVLVQLLAPVAYAVTGVDFGTPDDEAPLRTLALRQVPYYAGFLAAALVATHLRGNGPVRDLGFRFRPADPLIGVPAGVLTQLAGFVIYLPLFWLSDLDVSDLDAPARELADKAQGAGGVILLALVVVVAAPLVEEIFFRGLLLRAIERRAGTNWAVALSSIVFAATHFQLLQLPALALFGLVAAILTVRTGRLGPAIAAHCAFNAVALVTLLA
ncbi:MAG: lysostaphin resistance A-like protein [Acidimicrobiia bacterium]